MKSIFLCTVSFMVTLFPSYGFGQPKDSKLLKSLLWSKGSSKLKAIFSQPDTFRYQLIYTKIDRDRNNKPHFENYYYNVNPDLYFNPASTVKMPLAFLALEKVNRLQTFGVTKYSSMFTDSAWAHQSAVSMDTSAENGLPSIAQYIRKIFLVSDNDAYSRLYEFLGQQYINERLWEMGYKDMRITRRFVPMTEEENRHTNPIRFVKDGKQLYQQAAAYSSIKFDFSKKILIGNAHYDRNDSLINVPFDFTTHNNAPLEDLQQILQSVLFPASIPERQRFNLQNDDYNFLYRYMSAMPYESKHPFYDTTEYFSSYTKFFMFRAGHSPVPPSIRIFNKPGWSYGFLTDIAYIVDFENKVEFMISGVIYTNSDGVINDDTYDYETVGYPFFKEVGNIIYEYELKRKRAFTPDLSKFKMNYNDLK